MKKPLKIAVYSGEIPSTTFIERLVKAFPEDGYVIYLFGIKRRKLFYSTNRKNYGYRNTKLSKGFYLVKYWFLLSLFKLKDMRRLHHFLKSHSKYSLNNLVKTYPVLWHRPDIFHLQWAKGLKEWLWVKDFDMKLVLSLRGAHINYSPIVDPNLADIYRTSFPRIDGFHAVSKAIALEATKYGASTQTIHIVKSGLDLNAFPFSPKTYDSSQPLKIISIGRSHWKKNYSLALDALALLKTKNLTFSYTIMGVGDDEALQFQRIQLGLEEVVFFKAFKPISEVINAIKQADVLLLPSLEEGIANVVLEAMALGTLVISTDCSGMKEVISNAKNGFLVSLHNPAALAETINTVANLKPETYTKITQQARNFVEQNHSEAKMIQGMISLYNSVIQSRS